MLNLSLVSRVIISMQNPRSRSCREAVGQVAAWLPDAESMSGNAARTPTYV